METSFKINSISLPESISVNEPTSVMFTAGPLIEGTAEIVAVAGTLTLTAGVGATVLGTLGTATSIFVSFITITFIDQVSNIINAFISGIPDHSNTPANIVTFVLTPNSRSEGLVLLILAPASGSDTDVKSVVLTTTQVPTSVSIIAPLVLPIETPTPMSFIITDTLMVTFPAVLTPTSDRLASMETAFRINSVSFPDSISISEPTPVMFTAEPLVQGPVMQVTGQGTLTPSSGIGADVYEVLGTATFVFVSAIAVSVIVVDVHKIPALIFGIPDYSNTNTLSNIVTFVRSPNSTRDGLVLLIPAPTSAFTTVVMPVMATTTRVPSSISIIHALVTPIEALIPTLLSKSKTSSIIVAATNF